jgi:hypothetical protein
LYLLEQDEVDRFLPEYHHPYALDPDKPQDYRTGSVEVWEYNIHTDQHDLKYIARIPPYIYTDVYYLGSETSSILHTELTGVIPSTADRDIILDTPPPDIKSLDDNYGVSVDLIETF